MRIAAITLVVAAATALAASDPSGEEPELDKAIPFRLLPPRGPMMQDLLEAVCPGHVIQRKGRLGCDPSFTEKQAGNEWQEPWEVDGFVVGHFIGPHTEDAVVSGSRVETHPDRWGATLLLTKIRGIWKPVWYRSGIITRHCLPIQTESGRKILVCASGYYGMGHQTTALYVLSPGLDGADEELLLGTDTFNSQTVAQKQVLSGIELDSSANGAMLRVRIRHGRIIGRGTTQDPFDSNFPTKPYVLRFALRGTHLSLLQEDALIFEDLFRRKC